MRLDDTPWTEREERLLRECVAYGLPDSEIAPLMDGRTTAAVCAKRQRMGLATPRDELQMTPKLMDEITRWRAAGVPWAAIGRVLDRNPDSVRGAYHRVRRRDAGRCKAVEASQCASVDTD